LFRKEKKKMYLVNSKKETSEKKPPKRENLTSAQKPREAPSGGSGNSKEG